MSEKLEAYALGAIGALMGCYEVFLKQPFQRFLGELALRRHRD